MKEWFSKIKQKMKGMSPKEKRAYIRRYYWHYFLIGGIILGLVILLIYHLTLGNQKPVFQCVAVNQEIDLNRDSKVSADFADYLGVKADRVVFDSDYLISYDDVQIPEANESSYEKFFLNWHVHELDAMIIPESFYEYCQRQGGEFSETVELSDRSVLDKLGLRKPEDEKLLLCIPSDAKHPEEGKKFIEYISE